MSQNKSYMSVIGQNIRKLRTESKTSQAQLANKIIKYNRHKLFVGYAKIFTFLWFFPAASFLIPGGSLWLAVLPPLLLTSVLTLVLTEHTWTAFGFSRRSYWLMHTLALAALSAAAIAFRVRIGY